MDCTRIEDLISAFIENDLPEQTMRDVEAHLQRCHSCMSLKEKVEELMDYSGELEEEVPFFLRNRLYNIPDVAETEEPYRYGYLKWVAAMLGTLVLFLNLFYFTNVYPSANKTLHLFVSNVEKFAVEAGAVIERVKDTNTNVLVSILKDGTESDDLNGNSRPDTRGGTNG